MAVVKRRVWIWQQCCRGPLLPCLSQKKIRGLPTFRVHSYGATEKMSGSGRPPLKDASMEKLLLSPLGHGCCSLTLVHPVLEHFWDCTRRGNNFLFNPWCRINPKHNVLMKVSTDLSFDFRDLQLDLFGV